MLRCITLTLFELGEVFDDTLHIFDGVELCGAFLRLKELVDTTLDLTGEISEVRVHHASVEVIVLARDHDLLHLFRQVLEVLQVDSVVFNADKLVDHGLVGPLVEQRRDRVLLSIADKYVRSRRVARHSIDEVSLLTQLLLRLLGDVPAQGTVILVAENRVRPRGHDHSKEAVDDTISGKLILVCPLVGRVQA